VTIATGDGHPRLRQPQLRADDVDYALALVVDIEERNFKLGGVLAFAMFMNLVAAGIAGASIPLLLKKMKIDPALAGSVVLTTVTDIVGIFAFLGTATWLLI
jgi:magnesium transporter